jgi:hypothetical protein
MIKNIDSIKGSNNLIILYVMNIFIDKYRGYVINFFYFVMNKLKRKRNADTISWSL